MALTGAAGFIGRAVAVRLRAAGHTVIGCDRAPGSDVSAVDLRDGEAVAAWVREARPDAAVHAGAISGPMAVGGDLRRLFDVNVAGTVNLLAALAAEGVPRLVHLSSNAVYAPGPAGVALGEDAPRHAAEPYGASKIAAEAAIAAWAHAGGPAAFVLRLSSVYGAGRRTPYLFSTIARAFAEARPARVTREGENLRQFLHVEDAARAVEAALGAVAHGFEAVNVAGAEHVSEARIGALCARHLPGLRLEEIPHAGPTADTAGPLDCSRAARRLGWRPEIALAEGTAALFRGRGAAPAPAPGTPAKPHRP
ncbi:MAG: NAD(P)-dependent oxidoreductase [Pseudomonadota bacterium]